MDECDDADNGIRSGTVSSRTSCTGRRSLVSAVSTESGIHMGSDHDTAVTLGQRPDPQLLVQSKRLSKIIKNVRRSHSYNVSDVNKTNLKHRREVLRPKSLVHGWEDSAISIEELYLWQSQLKQLHMYNKNSHSVEPIAKTKLPKKESLREKAKTLIRGMRTKRKTKDSSVSSFCTDEDPDSTSSSLDRSSSAATNWSSKEPCTPSDILRILKVFAGTGLRTNSNAEYRSVLATIDSTVLEIKKQSISKYGFRDSNPMNYHLVCSSGFYTDDKGKTVSTAAEGFGTLSETWKEISSEYLTDSSRPLDLRNILEDMETTRLELRKEAPKSPATTQQDTITMKEAVRHTTGLHHYPAECPFLILIKGFDRSLDHVIYPLSEGETVFVSSANSTPTSFSGLIDIHSTETVACSIIRLGSKCSINKDTKREILKCGQSFYVGRHYKFLYREAIDNEVLSSGVGSPDTQRTLSTGTLISLSPELNSMSTVVHQHAEPRFIFYMEHKKILLDNILNYNVLSHRNMLACAQLTIMSLRHAFDHFSQPEITELLEYCRGRLESLAKVVQQKATEILTNSHKKSASDFLKPMLKLLAITLEIVHFLKEKKLLENAQFIGDIEKLAVPMYEHVAFHTTKMVYEYLPCILDPFHENETLLSAVEEPAESAPDDSSSCPLVSSESCSPSVSGLSSPSPRGPSPRGSCPSAITTSTGSDDKRRWSVPGLGPVRKRKMPKRESDRPRSESMCVVDENSPCSLSPNAAFRWSADEISEINNRNARRCSNGSASPNRRKSSAKQNLTNIGPGVKKLVQLLQKFHTLGNNCKLNDAMVKQLFVSIFFFSNTTLFNTIMESPQQYFNWHKGIQIRVHLDFVLRWAHHAQLSNESTTYFKSLNQLLDLLSLPKRDLISSSWSALSRTFPDLTPAQLNHVLSNYCTSQKPKIWKPTPPLSLVSVNDIRIELTAYPALVIPTRGYKLGTFSDIPDNLRSLLAKLTKTIVAFASGISPLVNKTIVCELQKSNCKPIGLKLKKTSSGCIVVSDIVFNSPAHHSGAIECHDEVLQINQSDVTGTDVALCKKLIQDSRDSVQIVVSRVR